MANLLFVRRVTIPTFYKRRVSRIFPALYVYLAVITIVLAVAYRTFEVRSIAAVFLLYFNYYAAGNGLDMAAQYQHIWSLCIEEHAYILLSLVAIVSRRSRIKDHVLIAATVLVSWTLIAVYTAVHRLELLRPVLANRGPAGIRVLLGVARVLAARRPPPAGPWRGGARATRGGARVAGGDCPRRHQVHRRDSLARRGSDARAVRIGMAVAALPEQVAGARRRAVVLALSLAAAVHALAQGDEQRRLPGRRHRDGIDVVPSTGEPCATMAQRALDRRQAVSRTR